VERIKMFGFLKIETDSTRDLLVEQQYPVWREEDA